jgi:hypothetical protein
MTAKDAALHRSPTSFVRSCPIQNPDLLVWNTKPHLPAWAPPVWLLQQAPPQRPLRMRGVWAREAVGVAPVALATRHAPFQVAPRACRAARVGRRTRLAVVVVGVSRPAPRQVQVRLPIRCRAWSPLCGLPAWQQSAAACPWIEPAFSRIDIGGRPAAALPSQRPSVSPGVGYPLTHLESRCSGLP